MRPNIFLVCCILSVFLLTSSATPNDAAISFSGNITGQISNHNEWSFRATSLTTWSLAPLIGCGAFYSSLSASGSSNGAEADSVWGSVYVVTDGWPISWLAYWDAHLTFDAGSDWSNIDITGAAGFVAHSYVSLIEKDPSGKVITSASLAQGLFYSYDITASGTSPDGTLKWVTITGSSSFNPWTISITFIMSNVVGVINYGNAIVGPKALESVIEIKNWPYANSANTLSLVMGVATGAASAQANALIVGSGSNQVYFSMAQQATVGGQVKPVSISAFTDGTATTYFNDDNIATQLSATYKAGGTIKVATVTFPAGANDIVYDPSVGVGQQPQNSAGTTVTFTRTLLFVVCVVVLSLLV